MLIQIQQDELEIAVRDYINKMGISRPVGEIKFTATRSGGAGIVTEIEIGDLDAVVPSPTKRCGEVTTTKVVEAQAEMKPVKKADTSVFTQEEEKEKIEAPKEETPKKTKLFSGS